MKSLEQIQQENRKFILEAILAGNNLRLLKENIADFSGSKLTLSRMLLALKDKKIGFSDKDLGAIWKGEYIYDDYIYEREGLTVI